MKHKAKRLDNGEWVEGYFDGADKNYPAIRVEGIGDEFYLIDPSTLCQQVRGTEFFEGDEVEAEGHIGYILWRSNMWQVDLGYSWLTIDLHNWKPTGKNKND